MNWIQRKIYLYNVTFGLYMLDWWERYLFSILYYLTFSKDLICLIYIYIYIYMCVCVCLIESFNSKWLALWWYVVLLLLLTCRSNCKNHDQIWITFMNLTSGLIIIIIIIKWTFCRCHVIILVALMIWLASPGLCEICHVTKNWSFNFKFLLQFSLWKQDSWTCAQFVCHASNII